MPENEIIVVEGRWFAKQNVSVRSLFDLISDLNFDHHHAYFHHMFTDKRSFAQVVKHGAVRRGSRFLYVGAHGDEDAVYGSLSDEVEGRVTAADVRKAVFDAEKDGGFYHGLFFGSCAFVNDLTATALLVAPGAPQRVKWIAGYSGSPDWMLSTFLDGLFWTAILDRGYEDSNAPTRRIKNAYETVQSQAAGLVETLDFRAYYVRGTSVRRLRSIDGDLCDESVGS